VCTCEFSLRRVSFDVILYDTHHSTMGVLHVMGIGEVKGDRLYKR
jgi:hypothetical protein